MDRNAGFSSKWIFGCGLALGLCAPFSCADAQGTTVYTFGGGNDGGNPPCGLIAGGKGDRLAVERFDGTTELGGTSGHGAVFEVTNTGSEAVLYSFTGGLDGGSPVACVLRSSNANLYGTAQAGGANGLGVVFKLAPDGTETVLHSFAGGSDGATPRAAVIMDAAGNLYGTTAQGGPSNLGVVFELMPNGTEIVLHAFGGSDGAYPLASLIMDANHNLYGTTSEGGGSTNCNGGCGTIFKVTPAGGEIVLHSFAGKDGAMPRAALIRDAAGNFYGTTAAGGAHGDGTVYKSAPRGTEIVLHSFAGGSDGAFPVAGVIEVNGYLYGTTEMGGAGGNGTVFKMPNKPGADTVLVSFDGGRGGALPEGGVISQGGSLFGTTYAGGNPGCDANKGCGVVFAVKP